MSNTAFSTPANTQPTQPGSATRIVVRSTSALEGVPITIYGTVSGSPDSDGDAGGDGLHEMVTAKSFTAITQAIMSSAAIGTITGYSEGIPAAGDVRVDVNPSDGNTLSIGLADALVVYRFKNTLAAAYDVKIGATKEITAANLHAAINSSGTPGTEYYAGTDFNPYLSSSLSVDVLTLTDRVPCNRQSGWSIVESASKFSKRLPIGGGDGSLLFTVKAGTDRCAIALTFSTEDHSTATLPALMLGVSNYVAIGGGFAQLRMWANHAITYKIQCSTDLINWTDTSEGTLSLSASTLTRVFFADLHDYIRLVIVSNANTTDTIADFRVIY